MIRIHSRDDRIGNKLVTDERDYDAPVGTHPEIDHLNTRPEKRLHPNWTGQLLNILGTIYFSM